KKSLQDCIDLIHSEPEFQKNIAHWETIPAREAQTVSFPESIAIELQQSLNKRGIENLYSHQREVFQCVTLEGKNVVVVTPTASGKTLCYNLPVLQEMVNNKNSRALYLFPTKALSQDQKSELTEWIDEAALNVNTYTYDGDTPSSIRQKIRQAGHVVMTNPDMLHSGVLPHHTKWVSLFENLKYVVIDEVHTYRGVFGSHVANVIRRLKRICQFYGSDPVFICTSATIANPKEIAEQLTGEPMKLIDNNGAPAGAKHFVFYNPPVVNRPLNIRRSATLEARKIAKLFLENQIQTIVFGRSRVRVEILLSYLQKIFKKDLGKQKIRGYRGGYLPKQRREIENGLRNGEVLGVVSTNALELGVDIGQLQVCVMTGYPGSVASTWQQAGRAGRRQGEALIFMVASSGALDQYMIQHPDYFFSRTPERARINPDNLIILVDHIKCAAYELPFAKGETFDGVEIEEVLDFLTEEQILHFQKEKWFWMNDSFPAYNISLRSASQENVVIIDQTETGNHNVIGEMDRFSAMTLLHDDAIYLHEGVQHHVDKLDWEEKKAYVRQVSVNHYTDANLAVQLKVLEIDQDKSTLKAEAAYGEVTVNAIPTIYKKIKFETHENIGWGPIHLPEQELHTSAAWVSIPEGISEQLSEAHIEHGLLGIANVLRTTAPLFVMCDASDLHVVPQVKAIHSGKPTVFLYDRYPGGIGLSESVYHAIEHLLEEARSLIERCSCKEGCPSCVGSPEGADVNGKVAALKILKMIL
ncbi:MAG TPA: DEAD/DEAH box helicase, partial [Bacillales bacterium]|nr:DEAD/DEAH box helicase [Bacillales bacterium]